MYGELSGDQQPVGLTYCGYRTLLWFFPITRSWDMLLISLISSPWLWPHTHILRVNDITSGGGVQSLGSWDAMAIDMLTGYLSPETGEAWSIGSKKPIVINSGILINDYRYHICRTWSNLKQQKHWLLMDWWSRINKSGLSKFNSTLLPWLLTSVDIPWLSHQIFCTFPKHSPTVASLIRWVGM